MKIWEKIYRPSKASKSRFHDLSGRKASIKRIIRNFPKALISKILLISGLRVPKSPWISYDAATRLKEIMHSRPCRVLEYGSGNSTLWFARHAGEVYSVEHNPDWHARVQSLLQTNKTKAQVFHKLKPTEIEYSHFQSESKTLYDIILIDGIWRYSVAQVAVKKLKPNGVLYLDNSDANTSSELVNEIPELLNFLDEWRKKSGFRMEVYTDFSPTALHATQGRMYYREDKIK